MKSEYYLNMSCFTSVSHQVSFLWWLGLSVKFSFFFLLNPHRSHHCSPIPALVVANYMPFFHFFTSWPGNIFRVLSFQSLQIICLYCIFARRALIFLAFYSVCICLAGVSNVASYARCEKRNVNSLRTAFDNWGTFTIVRWGHCFQYVVSLRSCWHGMFYSVPLQHENLYSTSFLWYNILCIEVSQTLRSPQLYRGVSPDISQKTILVSISHCGNPNNLLSHLTWGFFCY